MSCSEDEDDCIYAETKEHLYTTTFRQTLSNLYHNQAAFLLGSRLPLVNPFWQCVQSPSHVARSPPESWPAQRAIRTPASKPAPHGPLSLHPVSIPLLTHCLRHKIHTSHIISAQPIPPAVSPNYPPASNLLIIWRSKAPAPAKSPRSNGHSLLPYANISILTLVESRDLLH